MSKQNIVVAFGGVSPEHEVSVITALQAINALKGSSYRPVPLYIGKDGRWLTGEYLLELEHFEDLEKVINNTYSCGFAHDDNSIPVLKEHEKRSLFSRPVTYNISAVLVSFHGSDGENGAFQGICNFYNIPYTGCGVLSSALGMDKVLAKEICRMHDIPVTPGHNFNEDTWIGKKAEIIQECAALGYPVIVKPVHLGSSIGVQKAANKTELTEAVEAAFRFDEHVLVEKAVHPLKEINCSVLGYANKVEASVCEQPKGQTETLSFEDKYQNEEGEGKGMASTDRVIPADIPKKQTSYIQELSKRIFRLFGGAGIARLDFLINDETGQVYFNEINTIPGSFSFYLWDKSGYSFAELLEKLIEIARKTHQLRNHRVQSYDTNLLSQKAVKGLKGLKGNKSGT